MKDKLYIKVESSTSAEGGNIVTTCPICGKGGTFDKLNIPDLTTATTPNTRYYFGQRKCPNKKCQAHIFFRLSGDNLITFPALRIDFNSENIPDDIKHSLEEAITCHAEGCYTAAALMVRRTLEELCDDKKCSGDNLKQRIDNLKSNIVLPNELFEAMNELRLLGNDAAHIESKEYDQVGNDEVAVAIELTKEILKSVYQLDSLLKKLRGLKNP